MNKKQAIGKLRAVLGDALAYRERTDAPTATERATAHEAATDLRKVQRDLAEKRDALRAELLADPRYVDACRLVDAAREQADEASSASRRYAIVVGTISVAGDTQFFSQRAEGDTWDDVVSKVVRP